MAIGLLFFIFDADLMQYTRPRAILTIFLDIWNSVSFSGQLVTILKTDHLDQSNHLDHLDHP